MSNWQKTYNNITWNNDASPYLNASNLNANQSWIKELKARSEELYTRTSSEKQAEIEALAEQCQADAVSADADAKSAEQFANLASTSATTATSAVSTVTTAAELAQASATSASASTTSANTALTNAEKSATKAATETANAKVYAQSAQNAEKAINAEVMGTSDDTLLWSCTATSDKPDVYSPDGTFTDDCPIESVKEGSPGQYRTRDRIPISALKNIGLKIDIENGTTAIAIFSYTYTAEVTGGTRYYEEYIKTVFNSGDTLTIPSQAQYFAGIQTDAEGWTDVNYPSTFSLYMLPVYSIGTLTDEARDYANRAEAAAEILEGFDGTASTVGYDGSASGLDADTVQDAIDEVDALANSLVGNIVMGDLITTNIDFAAGTIGTRCVSLDVSVAKAGYTPIAVTLVNSSASASFDVTLMVNPANNNVQVKCYRCVSSAVSGANVAYRIIYLKNATSTLAEGE